MLQILTGENQAAWAVTLLYRNFPGNRCLDSITGTPYSHIGNHAQCWNLFDSLVSRAIFAKTDRVVCIDENGLDLHQCSHAQRIACILREHQECCAVRDKATMQRSAVHDGAHAELAYTIGEVVA